VSYLVEWYTPQQYVDAARLLMGSIDLDPASSDLANERVVKATDYYTEETDGLAQAWRGRVWLNPPDGREGPKFVAKLLDEYHAGNVTEAVLLVKPRTDGSWFRPLYDFTLCFVKGRIKFWNHEGTGKSPATGNVFIYLGSNRDKFAQVFSQFGAVIERLR
jgi:hypothetical protein